MAAAPKFGSCSPATPLAGARAPISRPPSVRLDRKTALIRGSLKRLEIRIKDVTREIEALAAKDDRARRLMTIPGIGPLGATALLASAGDARQFGKARDMAAWLGLVPRQHSTGGKSILLGISKRGSSY